MTTKSISWSQSQAFMTCQRRWHLRYVQGLEAKPRADDRAKILGSTFHAGMEAAMYNYLEAPTESMTIAGLRAIRQYVRDLKGEGTEKFWMLYDDIQQQAEEMLRFYLPQIGIGVDYFPVTRGEVLGQPELTAPAIEWEFDHKGIKGMVDAVFRTAYGEYVIVDWKTRAQLPLDDLALVDGQLHLYAAVLNRMGANINRVIMWQFRTGLPKPASISTKSNLPNTGAEHYDTTWEMWVATLPAGIDPEKYHALMQPKLKPASAYMRLVEGVVTPMSNTLALDNLTMIAKQIKAAGTKPVPAVLGSNACKFCEFLRLCNNQLRYGGELKLTLDEFYETELDSE